MRVTLNDPRRDTVDTFTAESHFYFLLRAEMRKRLDQESLGISPRYITKRFQSKKLIVSDFIFKIFLSKKKKHLLIKQKIVNQSTKQHSKY